LNLAKKISPHARLASKEIEKHKRTMSGKYFSSKNSMKVKRLIPQQQITVLKSEVNDLLENIKDSNADSKNNSVESNSKQYGKFTPPVDIQICSRDQIEPEVLEEQRKVNHFSP
jgi:hypothetical protein